MAKISKSVIYSKKAIGIAVFAIPVFLEELTREEWYFETFDNQHGGSR